MDMTMNNPYIENLVSMGYDRQDVTVASKMFQKKTFPCVIHGRQFDTEEQYLDELHEFMNGMWFHLINTQPPKTMTKKEALQEFRSCDCVVRGDRIATAENWNNYTDFLCKDRQITDKQYNNWTNPFWLLLVTSKLSP